MSTTTTTPPTAISEWMDITKLHASPTNPRKHFAAEELQELQQSMTEHGFKAAFPIYARPSKTEPGRLEIIAGERRYRSATAIGLESVPVVVEEVDDKTVLSLQLIENLQREALTAVEEGRAYVRLRDEFSLTVEEIAQRVGKPKPTVSARIRMLRAPELLLVAVEDEGSRIGAEHCVIVASIPDKALREKCAKEVLTGSYDHVSGGNTPLSVQAARRHVRENYTVSLKGCAWDIHDATLLPDAGACSGCNFFVKKMAETDEEMAMEIHTGGGGRGGIDPMTCTNPACHARKMDAIWKLKAAEARASGDAKVLTKDESAKLFYAHGGMMHDAPYITLDSKPGYNVTGTYDDSKTPSFRKLVKESGAKPTIVLARHPHSGEVVEMLPKKAALELAQTLKKNGKLKREAPTAAEKREGEKRAFDNKVAMREKVVTLDMMFKALTKRPLGIDGQRAVLESMLHSAAGMDGSRLMAEWLKLEPEAPKKGQSMDQRCYQAAIMKHLETAGIIELQAMTFVAFIAREVKQGCNLNYKCDAVMKHLGITADAIAKQAKEEVKAVIAAKKAKSAKPEKPKLVSKSAAAARNAGVNAKDEKTRDKLSKGKLTAENNGEPVRKLEDYKCDKCSAEIYVGPGQGAKACLLPKGEMKCAKHGGQWQTRKDFYAVNGLDPKTGKPILNSKPRKVSKNQHAGETPEEFKAREAKRIADYKAKRKKEAEPQPGLADIDNEE